MKSKKIILSVLAITFIGLFGFIADDDLLKRALESFQKYQEKNVQEKVYLHTDKPYYAIGDEIWFKAYVMDAQTLTPTTQSNILYVDLINGRDSVKKTLRIPLVAGFGHGNFELKDSLKEGNYRLRAYTNWMRNFGEGFYFDRTVKIGNAWTNQLVTKTDYTYEKQGNNENVTAKINFNNIDGFPYAKKEVSYQIELDFRNIAKGKAITDDDGNITINFTNDKPFLAKNGRITTSLKIADNTIVNKYIPIVSTSNQVDVQFFPEGGDLIQNVRSKVAFKALGADGLGQKISGYVEDNEGNKIVGFESRHLGMGYFTMTPLEGKTYTAMIKFADGSEKKINLPAIKPAGITLSVYNNLVEDSIILKVFSNKAFADKNQGKAFTVVAQNSGNIIYTAQSKLSGLAFAAKLAKDRFPAGITQFTLFDENMLPLSERLAFTMPKNILSLSVKPDKESYTQREKTNLSVKALGPDGKPIMGSFSMAVTDETKVPVNEDEEHTIFTDLLLTSDIKGYVEDPNYYFHDINDTKKMDLDVLMMTQGWSRFNWRNIINNVFPSLSFKPEKTLSVSGKVTQGKKPVVGGTVTLFSSSGGSFLIQTTTNTNGEFKIDSLYFPDSTKFVIQARNEKGRKGVDIELYNNAPQIVTKNPNLPDLTVNINGSMQAYLKNSKTQYEEWLKNGIVNRSILLGEVKVVDTKPIVEESSNLNGAGNADRVLTEKDFQNAYSMEQALQGRVAGLQIINGIAYIRNQPAQIILDGIYVDGDFLNTIQPQDVESVEILKSIGYTAIYGSRGGGGVIIINTKRGKPGYVSNAYAPGIITYSPIGIFQPKEFYSPNYADPKINTSVADLRTTIYWNPQLVTDSTGTAKVNFYNADGTGNYKIVLEGMDLNGHIGRNVTRYKVNTK
ncbi:TonB-dependent receptor plug domain-containing protein [Pedobacter sp. SD-b]|uniref:TonB-dependent receptor plug domain-containing protein n=1 Tax=Pedobacter segetis TaxID=2793069 RepID=A0ABS1BLG0_9SPHI|nr:carboxypeptidase-like regulatory domain-containing protein [Pedobacter segetis]MBK0383728.1 TonB-dependent receptor plug domain-containing protein [Pedobacter segetis]